MLSASCLTLAAGVFPGLMALSASTDLITMMIPNAIPAALGLGYLALAAALGLPVETVLLAASCGLATLTAGFLMFCRGWIGGGDAKLAAAAALWLGWGGMPAFVASASIIGGILTLGISRPARSRCPTRSHAAPGSRGCAARAAACPTGSRWPPPASSSTHTAPSGPPRSVEFASPSLPACRSSLAEACVKLNPYAAEYRSRTIL